MPDDNTTFLLDDFAQQLVKLRACQPVDAMEKMRQLRVLDATSPYHREDWLLACAHIAVGVHDWKLAGLAAYCAQRLRAQATGISDRLPDVAAPPAALRQYNPVRFVTLRGQHVMLRQPTPADADFLTRMFQDQDFLKRYSRKSFDIPLRVHDIISSGLGRPDKSVAWVWMICDPSGQSKGIVELTDLDFWHRSCGFMMGFPEQAPSLVVGEAVMLIAAVMAYHLGMMRVMIGVYADNDRSLSETERLGFQQEAWLPDEFICEVTGTPVSVRVSSLLASDIWLNPYYLRYGRHYISAQYPDLLCDSIQNVVNDAMDEIPWWLVFPPQPTPVLMAPKQSAQAGFPDHPAWHQILQSDYVQLAPPREHHRAVLMSWLADPGFVHRSGLQMISPKEVVDAILQAAKVGSLTTRLGLHWVVETRNSGEPVGLITLSNLNERQDTADLLLAFAEESPPRQVVAAAVRAAVAAAFHRLGLRLLKSMVGANAPVIQQGLMDAGFCCQGRLRSHWIDPSTGQRVDAWVNRLTHEAMVNRP